MIYDRHSNPLSGATQAAAILFDRGCEAFALYSGDPVALFEQASLEAPGFALAHLGRAWCLTLATEPEAATAARQLLDGLRDHDLDERAASHIAALKAALAGRWTEAANLLQAYSRSCPRDLLALQAGHLLDFLRADARGLRDRISQALPHWDGVPGRSWVMGMHAFGLEEMGDYARAEELGRAAVEEDPRDCWAHHAVAHVMEMQGRPADGLAWICGREAYWAGESNFLKVHNWWHRALCHIELGEPERALALFDGPVGRGSSAQDLIDAAALLWRLDLMGLEVGDRWLALSEGWEVHADGRFYPFNDFHAAMAHLGAGRLDAMEMLLRNMTGEKGSESAIWIERVGRPLISGLMAFRHARFREAAEALWSARHISGVFGGSHAQRDVIHWTLTEAALRGGLAEMGQALASERLALRPHSPVNLAIAARAKTLMDAA